MLNQEVVDQFFQLSRELKRMSCPSKQCLTAGDGHHISLGSLTMLQMHALSMMRGPEGVTMRELADGLQITGASASALADRLIETGWVERVLDDRDRRVVHLQLRPESKKRLKGMQGQHIAQMEIILNKLSLHDRQTLLRILRIFHEHMNELTVTEESK